jgi:hypothetical protein
MYPCSSILRRPGQSQKGRSKPRGNLWPGFLFRLGEPAGEVRALFPGWTDRLAPKPGQIPKAMNP